MGENTKMEKILVRQSPVVLVLRLIMNMIVTDLTLFFSSVVTDVLLKGDRIVFWSFMEYDTFILLILLLVQVLIAVYIMWDWYANYYRVIDNQIIWHRGIILQRDTVFVINQRMELVIEEGFWHKLLDFGSIKVKLDSKDQFVIASVQSPRLLLNVIQKSQQRVEEEK